MKKLTVEIRMSDDAFSHKGETAEEVAVAQGFGKIIDGLLTNRGGGAIVDGNDREFGEWKVERMVPPVEDLIDPILEAFYNLLKDRNLPERLLADAGKEVIKQVSRAIRNLTNPEG